LTCETYKRSYYTIQAKDPKHDTGSLLFFRIGWGVTAPMFMYVAADLFKGNAFCLIYGFVKGAIGIEEAFGTWVRRYIFDKTMSYQ